MKKKGFIQKVVVSLLLAPSAAGVRRKEGKGAEDC